MSETSFCRPEGWFPPPVYTLSELQHAAESGGALEGVVTRCDAARNLHVSVGGYRGLIDAKEAVSPAIAGADREIALLSRVGKSVRFLVTALTADGKGEPLLRLSRRQAQEQVLAHFFQALTPGTVLAAKVTHLEPFGAFVDIGGGIISLLPLERISVSRIDHPAERFSPGQKLFVVVTGIDRDAQRFFVSHKELLGTWLENAADFQVGDTVPGVVRTVMEYGAFVELTPNLSGLADPMEGIAAGDGVSVYLKSIRPEQMKLKLQIIEKLETPLRAPLRYRITAGQLTRWVYSPPAYTRSAVATDFTASL